MSLNETIFAVISNQGVDFIAWFHLSKGLGIFYNRGLAASNCSLLASVGEVVIAGDVIPLTIFMPNDHNAVFSCRKETVWLVGSPVLILQCTAVSPAEVMFKHLVIEADPLVIMAHTIHKHLFLMRKDACEVGTLQATLPFSSIPCASMSKVLVALSLEFVPAIVTCLSVLFTECTNITWETETSKCIKTIHTGGTIPTRVRVTFIKIKFTLVSAVSRCTGAHIGSLGRITGASVEAWVCFAEIRSFYHLMLRNCLPKCALTFLLLH